MRLRVSFVPESKVIGFSLRHSNPHRKEAKTTRDLSCKVIREPWQELNYILYLKWLSH